MFSDITLLKFFKSTRTWTVMFASDIVTYELPKMSVDEYN